MTTELAAALAKESAVIELEVGDTLVRLRGQVDAEALSRVLGVLEGRRWSRLRRECSCTPCPQDMRRGFDLLVQVVLKEMGGDPRSGDVFVFTSRGSGRVKPMWAIEIDGKGLAALIRGVDRPPRGVRRNRS